VDVVVSVWTILLVNVPVYEDEVVVLVSVRLFVDV
jgi:hypothetical protein